MRISPHANAAWILEMRHVLEHGDIVKPRGMKTREWRGATVAFYPEYNIVSIPERRLNYSFMAAEFVWMMLGRNDAPSISYFNKNIAPYSDDGVVFNGAYGPKIVDQMPYVIQALQADADSRQALLTIWRERPGPSKDIPCTISMQFFARKNHVEMDVYMRSNDLWLGMPYDIFNFTMIQRYVAARLGLSIGTYRHHVGSLHIYEQHWDKARAIIDEYVETRPDPALSIPRSPYLGGFAEPMPASIPTLFSALSTSGLDPDVEDIVTGISCPTWNGLMHMLAYRTHRDKAALPSPWKELHDAR